MISLCPRRDRFWEVEEKELIFKDEDGGGGDGGADGGEDGPGRWRGQWSRSCLQDWRPDGCISSLSPDSLSRPSLSSPLCLACLSHSRCYIKALDLLSFLSAQPAPPPVTSELGGSPTSQQPSSWSPQSVRTPRPFLPLHSVDYQVLMLWSFKSVKSLHLRFLPYLRPCPSSLWAMGTFRQTSELHRAFSRPPPVSLMRPPSLGQIPMSLHG